MSNFWRISDYLEAHPTPWRLVRPKAASPGWEGLRVYPEPDTDGYEGVLYRDGRDTAADVVVDANGKVVFETADNAGEASWLEGDVRALVDFVNAVGAAMNVRTERLLPDWASGRAGTLSEADKQRIMESSKRRFSGPVDEFLPCETDNKGSKETEE